MTSQFAKFVVVGVVATITTYLVLAALVELWRFDPVLASTIGYLAGIVVNYLLNFRFTFQSKQRHIVVMPKYLMVMTIGFLVNAGVMFVAVNSLGVHYAIAQLFAIFVVLVWSFTANRKWAFSE